MPHILSGCLADIFEKIATETATLARYNKKPTVTSREIQTAGVVSLQQDVTHHNVWCCTFDLLHLLKFCPNLLTAYSDDSIC